MPTREEINREIEARRRVDELTQYLPQISSMLTDELVSSTMVHGSFASAHEGYAVILEELDELWDEVKRRGDLRDPNQMMKEATQVAAMACRFLVDIILRGRYKH